MKEWKGLALTWSDRSKEPMDSNFVRLESSMHARSVRRETGSCGQMKVKNKVSARTHGVAGLAI